MLARVAPLRDRVLSIGVLPTDRPEERVRKGALVLTSVLITIFATAWTATYLYLGRPVSAAVPFTYQLISIVGLIYFARTRNFGPFRESQLIAMLILPFLLQWSLGGFVDSSAMMVWAFVAPLGALVLHGPREAAIYFSAYLGLTVVSGLIDPFLAAGAAPVPGAIQLLFFVLNLTAVSIVVYAVLQYFVADRNRAQRESDALLHNILPISIADRLRSGEQPIADEFEQVTVVFADVAGFTSLTRAAGADEIIVILGRLFDAFDALADRYGLEKIKTIGDAYMAVAGAPQPRPDHARAAAEMALAMLDEAARVSAEVGRPLSLRVGMDCGRAMAGVIGQRKFFYDLWGDAVNVASRMETLGVPGRIQVSPGVVSALGDTFRFEQRGPIEVKGVGEMRTSFLLGRA